MEWKLDSAGEYALAIFIALLFGLGLAVFLGACFR